jgi:LytS/YehU family sensor histidine kinase
MIYLWNHDKTKLIQKAGFGPKGSIEELDKQVFDVVLGQGVVGFVADTKQSVLIKDTRQDPRYRVDEMERLSEICVPIMQDDNLIGVIDAEHHEVNHFTDFDLQILQTIATNIAIKLNDLEIKKELHTNKKELAVTLENLKGAQLDALRSQMNPHFIFNSLNSIENYILKNERMLASEYLGKFSKLIRNILENSKAEKIPLQREIETLKLYIELERLRLSNKFEVYYNISNDVLEDNIIIPPMLMQPHVENAILHGIRYLDERKGRLTISMIITHDECLEYTLQDNGIGRAKSSEMKTYNNYEHKSYGIDITKNRIDLFNQKNNVNISYNIEDLYDIDNNSIGTKVTILIPLN